MSNSGSSRRFTTLFLSLVLVGLTAFAWFQRYNIYDFWRLRGYEPPARVVQLAADTTMTDYGRKLFYVNHPELQDKQAFNSSCTISEQSIVLGCFVRSGGIYLYDVTDERLNGVQQVTAAHEVLHAAYDRLSGGERERVDGLTQSVFASQTNERIIETVQAYRDRDPSVVPNELHSILATEVRNLPSELEDYYKRYFTDRQVVVNYSEQYEAAFREREAKVEAYEKQLESLKARIETLEASLLQQEQQLAAERARMDALLQSGQNQAYNSAVPGFNERVRRYNSDVAKIQALIDDFNRIVAERNAIALEENELIKAIDSRPATIPTE